MNHALNPKSNTSYLKPYSQDGPTSPRGSVHSDEEERAPEDTCPASGLPAEALHVCSKGFRHRLRPQSGRLDGVACQRRPMTSSVPECPSGHLKTQGWPASDICAQRPFPPHCSGADGARSGDRTPRAVALPGLRGHAGRERAALKHCLALPHAMPPGSPTTTAILF